ncbi:hypothetical protein [uncultured Dokdonia sp.]|uniref:hypothetical protein n=1 Tax=uncultured Dokdonia sp. TaxID=575653 RepID=UPI0026207837|nr:hypothetical protein [uncultured Dokdonia sp.]
MQTLYKSYFFIIILSLISFSCELDDTVPQNGPLPDSVFNTTADLDQFFGQEVTRSFFGEVVDTDHHPIIGALIEIGDQQVRTDSNGIFSLRDVPTHEKFSYLKASALGYVTSGRSLRPSEGVNRVKIMLFSDFSNITIQSGEEAQVTLPNGASILFSGAYIDANGNPYTGEVKVIANYLDPLDPDINAMMPGMLYGQDVQGDEAALETYGMISVELRGGGEKLNIDPNSPAEITFPVPPSIRNSAPGIIPLWSFDEDAGYWIEEGNAVFNGASYIAQVTHFSFWNCDAPFRVVDFCIRLTNENGNPITNITVILSSSNSSETRQGVTDENGEVCGKVPAGFSLDLSVKDHCENIIYENSIGPFNQDTTIDVMIPLEVDDNNIFSLAGTVLNCNQELVTNGYMKMYLEDETQYIPISNGMIQEVILNCSFLNIFSYEIIDVDALSSSGVLSETITLPITDIGTVQACTPSQEFISYTISGEELIYIPFNIDASIDQTSGGYNIFGSITGHNDFYFISSGQELGTYTFSFLGNLGPMEVYLENLEVNLSEPNTLVFELTAFGEVGEYIDLQFSGEYINTDGELKSVVGEVQVIRDN